MQWDLGLLGVAVLLAMALAFGALAQLVAGRATTRWLWSIAAGTFFVTGLLTSEVWFGWATEEDLQPNIDGLSFDEVLLIGLLAGVASVLITRHVAGRHGPGRPARVTHREHREEDPMTEQDTLFFPERRIDGAFPVTDAHGNPVARVTATWSGGRFSVTSIDRGQLCEGATSRWWLSGKWQVNDADGAPLLTVAAKPLRNSAVVHLARDGDLIVRGSPWRRDFTVADPQGRTVLSAAPRTSSVSPRQHDYAVHQSTPGALRLAEVIAIVQVWRMVKKSDAAVLAATSTTVLAPGA